MGFLSVRMSKSLLRAPFLSLFSFSLCRPIPVYLLLFHLILFLSLRCLFLLSNKSQKGGEFRGKGSWGGTGRRRGKGNCNQKILYGKGSLFSIKEIFDCKREIFSLQNIFYI